MLAGWPRYSSVCVPSNKWLSRKVVRHTPSKSGLSLNIVLTQRSDRIETKSTEPISQLLILQAILSLQPPARATKSLAVSTCGPATLSTGDSVAGYNRTFLNNSRTSPVPFECLNDPLMFLYLLVSITVPQHVQPRTHHRPPIHD